MAQTTADSLTALIERLEAATAPHRRLDEDIAEALGLRTRGKDIGLSEPYTSSFDAALTLVPKGLAIKSTLCSDGKLQIQEAWFHRKGEELHGLEIVDDFGPYIIGDPAIALCIVAIKARADEAVRSEKFSPQ